MQITTFSQDVLLRNGAMLRLRPLQATDRAGLRELFNRCSPETRRLRFLRVIKELSDAALDQLTAVDGANHVALVVTLLGILAFEASRSGRSIARRGVAATAALALAALGWHFQETTVIALGAILVAFAAALIERHWQAVRSFVLRRPAVLASAAALAFGGAMTVLWAAGLLHTFSTTALWAARDASRFQFYLIGLRDELPLLWPLLPAAAVLALASAERRTLALFATVIVAAALLVHSIAAQKTMRYVYYVVPWMCVLWGLALAQLAGFARRRGTVVVLATTVAIVGGLLLSREGARALNLAAGRTSAVDSRPFRDEPDWTPAVRALAPHIAAADRIITSNSMKALYYFGRYDLELNATIVAETDTRAEFGLDERTGRRVIGLAASLRTALDREDRTLVLVEQSKLGRESGVSAAAVAVLDRRCTRLDTVPTANPLAWWCSPDSGH